MKKLVVSEEWQFCGVEVSVAMSRSQKSWGLERSEIPKNIKSGGTQEKVKPGVLDEVATLGTDLSNVVVSQATNWFWTPTC